ncbi:hypothetical protein FSP39_024366 [Pinctada imbricata]|uniref:Macro domain-containing protein n=1 Tax=Pinctada imbricata TaxID=66713 RepID=A0AA88YG97_PINIB|nr:hypothetical protein FSP39_024366 [Pinctada imbricata]
MESMNSVLKDTEKILRESNLAAESAINRYTFNVGHIKVRIYHGNITAVETAGLVNAANGSLANGAGVAGAIARAASPTMQQECDAYIKKFGILGTGEVMHTRAGGRLSARVSHIIHAVGPIWLEGLPDRCAYELTLTYLNVLKYAEKLWLPSITLPCISSGIFGSPLDVSIKCFLDGLLLFVSESKKDYHLLEVNMVNNDEDGVITTIAILQSLLEAGQDLIMAQAIDRFTKLQEKRKPSTKVFSSSLSSKTGTKDDFHSLDYGKPSPLMSTDPGKRRSSSLSRATGKTKMKDPESPRGANLEGGKSKGSGLSVSGKNPGSTLDRSASERSGSVSERRSRLDSAGSSRPTTASRLSTASGAKNSPRAPPTMKQSLVTSPPGGGAKPKTKTNTSSRNVPMKASTLIPSETRNQMLSPRTEAAISKTSQRDYNVYENDIGLHSLPADLRTASVRHVEYNTDKPGSASEGSLSARETLIKSTQPSGTMSSITRRNLTVPGYEYCEGAIEIHYDIPSGKQGKYDPLPGQSYTGVQHKAYLPNSAEGREILRLLKHAFKANKVFRISGRGTIEWNISHKTKISSFSTEAYNKFLSVCFTVRVAIQTHFIYVEYGRNCLGRESFNTLHPLSVKRELLGDDGCNSALPGQE